MIEAAMIWNEANNKSHWDIGIDPEWSQFAAHVIAAGEAIHAVNPAITRVLGGMSPIDGDYLALDLPARPAVGDFVRFDNVGAYSISVSSDVCDRAPPTLTPLIETPPPVKSLQ